MIHITHVNSQVPAVCMRYMSKTSFASLTEFIRSKFSFSFAHVSFAHRCAVSARLSVLGPPSPSLPSAPSASSTLHIRRSTPPPLTTNLLPSLSRHRRVGRRHMTPQAEAGTSAAHRTASELCDECRRLGLTGIWSSSPKFMNLKAQFRNDYNFSLLFRSVFQVMDYLSQVLLVSPTFLQHIQINYSSLYCEAYVRDRASSHIF